MKENLEKKTIKCTNLTLNDEIYVYDKGNALATTSLIPGVILNKSKTLFDFQ